MAYTNTEKISIGNKIAAKMISYEGHNKYSQSDRYNIKSSGTSGSGDCSSTVWTAIKAILGIQIGGNTTAQITNSNLVDVNVTIKNGIPDESMLLPGDLFYFRGSDPNRKWAKYVGHVEMYVGNGQLSGHGGPGIGPTRKNMVTYCKNRQNSASSKVSPANKGLICVKRLKVLDGVNLTPSVVTEGCYPKYTGTSASIIEALRVVGCKDTSKAYRTKIAIANGIVNYTGTADQNSSMVKLLKAGTLKQPVTTTTTVNDSCFPRYTGGSSSIVVALEAVGCKDTSKAYRAKIATANGIVNYTGTSAQNTSMVKLLKAGKLKKA